MQWSLFILQKKITIYSYKLSIVQVPTLSPGLQLLTLAFSSSINFSILSKSLFLTASCSYSQWEVYHMHGMWNISYFIVYSITSSFIMIIQLEYIYMIIIVGNFIRLFSPIKLLLMYMQQMNLITPLYCIAIIHYCKVILSAIIWSGDEYMHW